MRYEQSPFNRYPNLKASSTDQKSAKDKVRARIPGVDSVGIINRLPTQRQRPRKSYAYGRHHRASLGKEGKALLRRMGVVTPGYFENWDMQLAHGRSFVEPRRKNLPTARHRGRRRRLANRALPNENQIGKRLQIMQFGRASTLRPKPAVRSSHRRAEASALCHDLTRERPRARFTIRNISANGQLGCSPIRTKSDPRPRSPIRCKPPSATSTAASGLRSPQHEQSVSESCSPQRRFKPAVYTNFRGRSHRPLEVVGLYGTIAESVTQRTPKEIGTSGMAWGRHLAERFRMVLAKNSN